MESAHPEPRSHLCTDKRFNALTHFTGGLVGKCKSQYTPRFITKLQQMHYLVGQHTRLSRARACDHETRPFDIFHGIALLDIKLIEIILCNQ